MVFQSKMTPFKRWVEPERIQKYVNFFGPGVDAEVRKEANERKPGEQLPFLASEDSQPPWKRLSCRGGPSYHQIC